MPMTTQLKNAAGKLAAAALVAAAVVAVAPATANATLLKGTAAVGSAGYLPGAGETLNSAITVVPGNEQFGVGTDDFAGFSGIAVIDTGFDITNLATLKNYSFTSTVGGFSFVTADAFTSTRSDSVLNVKLIGTFTNLSGSAPAALIANFSQVGGAGTAISYSGTLTTTFTPIPEPISLAVLGVGLLGLGLVRYRQA